jgi:glycolate oxidase FAD binding subunit
MAKLYAGSLGTLGVIEAAWLRLRPKPPLVKTAVIAFDGSDPERASRTALDAARRATASVVAVVAGEPAVQLGSPATGEGAAMLVVEYAGDAPAVERDLEWLLAQAGGREVPEESRLVGRLRDLQSTGAVRSRIATLPTRLADVTVPLGGASFGTIAYPGVGVVYAISEDPDAALAPIDALTPDANVVFESLPLERRRERDVFGEPGAEARIARALKERFDPAGILNPGRFQGRL